MTSMADLISATEASRILGFKARSSLTRLVQSRVVEPVLQGEGVTSAQFFDRADIERLAKDRASQTSSIPGSAHPDPPRQDVPTVERSAPSPNFPHNGGDTSSLASEAPATSDAGDPSSA